MCDIIRCACGCVCIGLYGLVYSGAWLCSPAFRKQQAEARRERVEREEAQRKEIDENLARATENLAKIQEMIKAQSRLDPKENRA